MMIIKEQGWRVALGMLALIVPFAFFVGGVLNQLLHLVW
jgi:ferrous iron transport protein B